MYPAKDLSELYASRGYDTAYDNLPDDEVIGFQTVSINPVYYEYGNDGAASHMAIIQARILRKNHADLLTAIETVTSDLDGKRVSYGDNSYEVSVNSIVYQGFKSTAVGLMRYAVVTLTMNY